MLIEIDSKEKGLLLADILTARGFAPDLPCGGSQRCGRCRMRASGGLKPPGEAEREFLSAEELAAGWRLACSAVVVGDIEVELPETQPLTCSGTPLGINTARLGLAIDIGTTTVRARLVEMQTRLTVAEISQLNLQRSFGADTVSRVEHALRRGVGESRAAIIAQLERMTSHLCALAQAEREQINEAVIVGNTVMLHLLTGRMVKGLSAMPFAPDSLFDEYRDDIIDDIPCYLPPCRSAFIGADLLAGLLSAGLHADTQPTLFLDIGTNGEIALSDGRHINCCSAAAGPVFEGMSLSFGMAALPGAVSRLRRDGAEVSYDTIDNAAPIGFCGSGIVSALAMLLDAGSLNKRGLFQRGGRADSCLVQEGDRLRFKLPGADIYISQGDIRQIQLAKAAIAAAGGVLLSGMGLNYDDLSHVLLAGALGSELDDSAAAAIGLLPAHCRDKVRKLGHAALDGATLLLSGELARSDLRSLCRRCQVTELAGNKDFEMAYLKRMALEAVY